MNFKKTILTQAAVSLLIVLSGCTPEKRYAPGHIPESWYILPENRIESYSPQDSTQESALASSALASTVDRILESTEKALEKAQAPGRLQPAPWHVSYFITDLSITLQGLLGVVIKGTPSVELSWFPQYPLATTELTPHDDLSKAPAEIAINGGTSAENISSQIDSLLKAAMATGLIQDPLSLRSQLVTQATEFQKIASALDQNPGLQWWPSRYRIDFTIDASGKLTPAMTLGGGIRLRLAWYRIKRKSATHADTGHRFDTDLRQNNDISKTRSFVAALAEDIQSTADQFEVLNGFKAYSIKIAITTTLKGTLGVAKTSGSMGGFLYFSRDVPKPIVHPIPTPPKIALIEKLPSEQHIRYALNHRIRFEQETANETVYEIDRETVRKGLKQAATIASFFTQRASLMKPESKEAAWKIYELLLGFEFSISGDVGLIPLGETATTELSFYNQNF